MPKCIDLPPWIWLTCWWIAVPNKVACPSVCTLVSVVSNWNETNMVSNHCSACFGIIFDNTRWPATFLPTQLRFQCLNWILASVWLHAVFLFFYCLAAINQFLTSQQISRPCWRNVRHEWQSFCWAVHDLLRILTITFQSSEASVWCNKNSQWLG